MPPETNPNENKNPAPAAKPITPPPAPAPAAAKATAPVAVAPPPESTAPAILLPDNATALPDVTAPAAEQLRRHFHGMPRKEAKRFECVHPIENFGGREHGVTFAKGWGTTDSPAQAHDAVQNGFAVFDHQVDRLAFGSGEPDAAERVLAARAARQAKPANK